MMTTALPPDAGSPHDIPSPLRFGEALQRNGVSAYRKTYDSADKLHITSPSTRTGILLGVSLTDRHRRSITKGELAGAHLFSKGDIYLRDLDAPYAADVEMPFDFALFEFSTGHLDILGEERLNRSPLALSAVAARPDPVLAHLTYALLPSLARPSQASSLFVDQIFATMATYLLHTFGSALPDKRPDHALSRAHEERAKALLLSKLQGECSITNIARECNMSAGYFMKAFKVSTGKTPHQWMMSERLAQAQRYLRKSSLSLTEVANSCGFYDQSHFNRFFARNFGMTPGAWRRQAS